MSVLEEYGYAVIERSPRIIVIRPPEGSHPVVLPGNFPELPDMLVSHVLQGQQIDVEAVIERAGVLPE